MSKKSKKHFYRVLWPNSKKFGVAMGPVLGGIKTIPRAGYADNWQVPMFNLEQGEFADYQGSNWAVPMFSEKMKSVIDQNKTCQDPIQWLPTFVKKEDEVRPYYILHFPEIIDEVIDLDHSVFAGGGILKPIFRSEKLESHCVFKITVSSSSFYINPAMKKALKDQGCTCIEFGEVPIVE